VLIETWLIPVEGYLVDRFGPRWVVIAGAVLVAIAWVINSGASSLPVLYFAAAVGGIGTGCVYGTCVGNALKWFQVGAGSPRALPPRASARALHHHRPDLENDQTPLDTSRAFLTFGLIQGAIVFVMAWGMLVAPSRLLAAKVTANQTAHGYSPSEVLRSPVFYVMYVMFVLIRCGRFDHGRVDGADCQRLQD